MINVNPQRNIDIIQWYKYNFVSMLPWLYKLQCPTSSLHFCVWPGCDFVHSFRGCDQNFQRMGTLNY